MRDVLNHRTMSSLILLFIGLLGSNANAAEVCFHQAGTYGPLTVTRSGSCGRDAGSAVILGANSRETCTFNFSYSTNRAVDPGTLKVRVGGLDMDYLSSYLHESALFYLNGTQYYVNNQDIDNSSPAGGLLVALGGGVEPAGPSTRNAAGTVSFGRYSEPVTALAIEHRSVGGQRTNGGSYQVCLDDAGILAYDDPTASPQTTNNASPTLTGTQDKDNTALTVTINNVTYTQGVSQALTVDANGTWSLDLAAAGQTLPDNVYDVVVSSTDGVFTAVDGTSNELVVDTMAPVLGIDT